MKILKRAEIPSSWSMEATCDCNGNMGNGCGSLVLLEIDDLVYWPGVPGDTWGSRDPVISWRCPVCNGPNDLRKGEYVGSWSGFKRITSAWYRVKRNKDYEAL